MTRRSVYIYNTEENYGDLIDILVSENAVNNVPNSLNTISGEITVWNGSTYSLQGNTSIGVGLGSGIFHQGVNCVAIGYSSGIHEQASCSISIRNLAGRTKIREQIQLLLVIKQVKILKVKILLL